MKMNQLQLIIVGLIVMALSVSIALITDTVLIYNKAGNIHGAVSSSSALCSSHGRNIMKEGGSAVDAVISTALCIGVVNAHSSGIGGGAFMVVRDSTGDVQVFDARETAPSGATKDMFKNRSQSRQGGLAVGVPGFLKGIYQVHELYGKLPWIALFQHVIKLCDDGVEISKPMESSMKSKITLQDIRYTASLGDTYSWDINSTCCFKKSGDTVKLEKMASTMSLLAREGIDSFYDGEIGDNIISAVVQHGGIMTKQDLKNYKILTTKPIKIQIRDKIMFSMPPPSISSFIFAAIKILDRFAFKPKDFECPETYRKILETFRYVYSGVENFGDVSSSVEKELKQTMSQEYFEMVYKKVTNGTVEKDLVASNPSFIQDSAGTSHISVIDENGQTVSMTLSINRWFGSDIMTQDGIILNNHMDDFTPYSDDEKFANNYPSPGRRPMSGMSPVIITDDQSGQIYSLGGTNGTRIVTGLANVLINILYRDFSLKEAIEAPRLHILSKPDVFYENGFDPKILKGLEALGYELIPSSEGLNIVNGVYHSENKFDAWADSRKFGEGIVF